MRTALGLAAVILSLAAYVPYIRDTLRRQTKPHAFSWLIWASIATIGFTAQITHGGGAGSWITGAAAAICFFIFVLALILGDRHFVVFDWCCLALAVIATVPWVLFDQPIISVAIAVLIDIIAFSPTFRKVYTAPYSETGITYILGAVSLVLSMTALEHISALTIVYPACLTLIEVVFIVLLYGRQHTLQND